MRPFIHAGLGYSSLRKTWWGDFESGVTRYRGMASDFGGGVSCFINKRVSFDLGLKYTRLSMKQRDIYFRRREQSEFGCNIGFSVFLEESHAPSLPDAGGK
jgi:outer membrane protein